MFIPFHQIVDDAVCPLMALRCEVEIDHGGVQTIGAQVLLDATDVDAGFQKMNGIAVPEGMDGNTFPEFELFKDTSQCSLNGGMEV